MHTQQLTLTTVRISNDLFKLTLVVLFYQDFSVFLNQRKVSP